MKIVAFDVWADYANFRRGYTNTSSLTYPFPTRTNIAGLVSAILGLPRNSYHETIFNEENSHVGCRILNPIEKINYNMNLINTKDGFTPAEIKENPRVQVYGELLKNVKYRIYVSLKDNVLLEKLFNMLKAHKTYYTPYLGNSTCICDFKIASEEIIEAEKKYVNNDGVAINSVILKKDDNLILEPGKRYASIKNTGYMTNDRVVTKWLEYYYLEEPGTLLLKNDEYYVCGGENIVLY